jgi:hypothetical protein
MSADADIVNENRRRVIGGARAGRASLCKNSGRFGREVKGGLAAAPRST